MRLKTATILVIVSVVITFLFRISGMLFQSLFTNPLAMKTFGIISLLSFLAIVLFFVFFFMDYTQKEQILLKISSILMIIGSSAIFILFVKAVLSLFKIFPSLYYYSKPGFLEALVPCIVSAFSLFFFIAFYKEMVAKMSFHLKLAVILAIVSSLTTFILKSIVLANYLSYSEFRWFLSVFQKFPVLIILLSAFWFLTSLYFYISFYRELEK